MKLRAELKSSKGSSRRHNLSLNIQKLKQDIDYLSNVSMVTPKRAKQTFKDLLLVDSKTNKQYTDEKQKIQQSNIFTQPERLQTNESNITDSQFSNYFTNKKNNFSGDMKHEQYALQQDSYAKYRLKDNYFSDKKHYVPDYMNNNNQISNKYPQDRKIQHSGPMFSTMQPQSSSCIPEMMSKLKLPSISPFCHNQQANQTLHSDTMVLSFSNLNISNYNNINNYIESPYDHNLSATPPNQNLTSSLQTQNKERDSDLTNLTADGSEKSKNSQFGLQAVLTKKLEEMASVLSKIKHKISVKNNDQIVEKLDSLQKKLSKNEKFVQALGKLAQELESSIELGSIFKQELGSIINKQETSDLDEEGSVWHKDPKQLWKWIKSFFVKFMEMKKIQVSFQRQVENAKFQNESSEAVIEGLKDKLSDLEKLEIVIKEFFGLDSGLGSRGVVCAVERMCGVAAGKK